MYTHTRFRLYVWLPSICLDLFYLADTHDDECDPNGCLLLNYSWLILVDDARGMERWAHSIITSRYREALRTRKIPCNAVERAHVVTMPTIVIFRILCEYISHFLNCQVDCVCVCCDCMCCIADVGMLSNICNSMLTHSIDVVYITLTRWIKSKCLFNLRTNGSAEVIDAIMMNIWCT